MKGGLGIRGVGLVLFTGWFCVAEIVTVFASPSIGVGLHAALLVGLLIGASRSADRGLELYLVMSLLPMARLLSYTMPLGFSDPVRRLAYVNAPLIVGTVLAARLLAYRRRALGLQIRNLPLQLLLGTTGIPIALLLWPWWQPDFIIWSSSMGGGAWLNAGVLLAVGLGEELLFRGVIQKASIHALGIRSGLVFTAFLYGVMHLGWLSVQHVLVAMAVGCFFGITAYWTRSIFGVGLAHGTILVLLFVVLPTQ